MLLLTLTPPSTMALANPGPDQPEPARTRPALRNETRKRGEAVPRSATPLEVMPGASGNQPPLMIASSWEVSGEEEFRFPEPTASSEKLRKS